MLQDFTPLADSLEWELGARYFARRGSLAFLSEHVPVPYTVNNTGTLSRAAAEVLFAALASTADDAPRGEICVLELGIGLGLFARYFLDAFRELCTARAVDYYDRLTYVAADYSERMLLDAVRRGTFENHPGRYLLRVIDALDPRVAVLGDPFLLAAGDRPFFAVFLNYLLDCLPVTVLRAEPPIGQGEPPPASETGPLTLHQLCVRTCLGRGVSLHEFTELSPDDIARLAASTSPEDRNQLLDLFGLFNSEYDYRPVRAKDLPYGSFIRDFTCKQKGSVVHSHGAIASLERLLGLLHPHGIIQINDYGSPEGATSEQFEHQRYGSGSFVGLNFGLLKEYFTNFSNRDVTASGPLNWVEPTHDSGHIYSRLMGTGLHPDVVATFRRCFDGPTLNRLEEPVQFAQAATAQGRLESAATAYRVALERQPWNWQLILQAANFLTFGLRDVRAGMELARAGLELNPCCSPELWNAYGDACFSIGRVREARHSYEQALAVNPDDVQGRYNLAWVHLHRKEHNEALRVIAEALALDWRGVYRERLLQKQAEVLVDLARRAQQEFQTLIIRHHISG